MTKLDPHVERDVVIGDETRVFDLRKLEDEETLLGRVHFCGGNAHVLFLRVEGGDEGVLLQRPVRDPHGRWDAFTEAEPEGAFQTVEVPGFEGDYVFMVTPFLR